MAWKKGPLPPGTWNWGGVVVVDQNGWYFQFADFHGDHVTIFDGSPPEEARVLQPAEVAWYDNSLEMPPINWRRTRGRGKAQAPVPLGRMSIFGPEAGPLGDLGHPTVAAGAVAAAQSAADETGASAACGEGIALLEERFMAKRNDEGYGFDPIMILAIITVVIPMIQQCFRPTAHTLRRRTLNRTRVASALYREVGGLSWVDSLRAADRLFDLAGEAEDHEIQMFIDDCHA